jgi:hypothetical protein
MARDHYWASEMGCVAELIGTHDERHHYHDMPRTARGILFSLTFCHQEQPAESQVATMDPTTETATDAAAWTTGLHQLTPVSIRIFETCREQALERDRCVTY